MTDVSLTPALALSCLHELSLDVRAAVVLGPTGDVRAGDVALADRVRSALGETAPGGTRTVRGDGEMLVVVRAADGGAIAVSAGPRALLPLLLHDLRTLLDGFAGAPSTTS